MRALRSWNESILARILSCRNGRKQIPYRSYVSRGCFFVFGKETKGLPKAIVEKYADSPDSAPHAKGG